MRDVARVANVSQSTVSRVLSAGDISTSVAISAETIQRVNEAVQELGYQPNMHARSLRGQKTQLIAMMLADIANPYTTSWSAGFRILRASMVTTC